MNYNNFHDVGRFHEKFGLDNVTHNGSGPREIDPKLMEFRIKFMQEELDEFIQGYDCDPENHEKMADALVDLVYVAMGTAHLNGYPWQQIWDEVQTANMRKIRATNPSQSKRGSTFDVVKPEGWQPPAVREVLEKHGWEFE